jgi:hypothetical protein
VGLVSGRFFCGPACCLPAAVSDFCQASSCSVPVIPVVLLLGEASTFVFFVLGSLALAVGVIRGSVEEHSYLKAYNDGVLVFLPGMSN